ncbi:hypothetical protein [Cyanobium sp. WKJ7-Wakatipu]|uniref:hypothetical protein n=1 Tax=Cyanobium sp. WKJ7-Wakatipu TaxID=2823726 RepID=UPI0020CE3420|nr:hypothetical protein [Cyanobium sp. WKJ7-Wakatipu]
MATTLSQHLPHSFFCRPAEQVAPELISCLLVKGQEGGELLWGDKATKSHSYLSPPNASYLIAII